MLRILPLLILSLLSVLFAPPSYAATHEECGKILDCMPAIKNPPRFFVPNSGYYSSPSLPPDEGIIRGSQTNKGFMSYGEALAEINRFPPIVSSWNNGCYTSDYEEVGRHIASWFFSTGKGGPSLIDYQFEMQSTPWHSTEKRCGNTTSGYRTYITEHRTVSCPSTHSKYFFHDSEDQYYCYKELCPGMASNATPSFTSKSFARWYEAGKCPVDFEPQNSCQAGGSGKYATNNPIACRTGEKLKTETDYSGPAGLAFTRHYSSMPQLSGTPSSTPQWFASNDITFSFVKKAAHGQIAELRFGDGGRLLFVGGGTATTLTASTTANGSLSSTTGSWIWSNPKGEKYSFGTGGKVASKTLKNGQVFAYTWQDAGAGNYRLTGVTEPFGRRVRVEYDAQGRMSAMIDPADQHYRYGYDATGNLQTVMFPDDTLGYDDDNAVKTYLYEDARLPHHLTGILDENGDRYSHYGYDEQGRAILSELGNHTEKVTMEYLETGNSLVQHHQDAATYREKLLVIDRTHGADRVTREEDFPCPNCNTGTVINEYNSNGWLSKTTDRSGHVTTYIRDTSGRETSRTESVGTPEARTTITSWSGTNSQPYQIKTGTQTITHTYNSKGQLTQRSDNDSATSTTRTTKYAYTTAGQLATVDGARTDASDITRYSYDGQGNLLTATNAKGQITHLTNYDAHGKVGTLTDPNGLITTLTYTPRGWLKTRTVGGLTTAFDYDKVGQLKKVTMPDASFIAYEYDAAHRLTAISNTLGERIEYTLDYAGNRIKEEVKAADGSVVLRKSRVFNALNQLLQDLNAANQPVASYAYDANGNLIGASRYTDSETHQSSYGYDPLNRLNTITDALNGSTAFKYDGLDQLTEVSDPKNLVTQYGVDGLGQLKQTTSPDTGVASQTYDSAGNVKTSTNARGHTSTYTYDALNRVTRLQYHDSVAVTFTYDETSGGNYGIGRLTTVTDSSGSTSYRYDQHGRLLHKTQTIAGTALATTYGYDSYGRLVSVTYPSGNLLGLRYNRAGQVDALRVNGSDALYNIQTQPFGGITSWRWSDGTLQSRSFDLDGRLTSYPLGSETVTLNYDRAGRLTNQTGAVNQQFDYDALDRLTGTTSAINQLFSYDANGNRESFTQDRALSDYTVASSSNRLTAISGAPVTGEGARSYHYDAAGNTLSDGTRTFDYNTANRLSRITNGSVIVDNHYNGLGQRVRKLVSGSQSSDTRYVYDEAGQTVGEYNADGSLINEIVYLNNMPVLLIRPAGVYNIQTDQLNTPRAILNSAQTVVWKWDSDAFGSTPANEDPDNNGLTLQFNLRFPGQIHDSETGLHYNYFRDYDPQTGRYVESDPIGLGGGINTYNYALSNPLSHTDPTGEVVPLILGCAASAPCAAAALVAGAIVVNSAMNIADALGDRFGQPSLDDPNSYSGAAPRPAPYSHAEESMALSTPPGDDCNRVRWALLVLEAQMAWRKLDLNPSHIGTRTYVNHQDRIKNLRSQRDRLKRDYDSRCKQETECGG